MGPTTTEGVREILRPLRDRRLCALDTVVPGLADSLAVAVTRTELMLAEAEKHHLPERMREDLGIVRWHLLGLSQLAHELPVLCAGPHAGPIAAQMTHKEEEI
jgi:hypothetical protein